MDWFIDNEPVWYGGEQAWAEPEYQMEGYGLMNPRGVIHALVWGCDYESECGRWMGIVCGVCDYYNDDDVDPGCSSDCPLLKAGHRGNPRYCEQCFKDRKEWTVKHIPYVPKHKPGMVDSLSKTIEWLDALGLRR